MPGLRGGLRVGQGEMPDKKNAQAGSDDANERRVFGDRRLAIARARQAVYGGDENATTTKIVFV
jgi:hypothetical protein